MKRGSVVDVLHLRKAYGATVAVDDVSFSIDEGEIIGMVGPNGAGKTTIIECVEGLRRPDSGDVRVLGLDPRRDGQALRERMGIQLQQAALHPHLTVWEAVTLFASFYPRRANCQYLLEQLGLVDRRDVAFGKLSGGQKQRLFIALALVNDPEVVFLDELTTGLDPQARRAMWDYVRQIRDRGTTVFLTTHFMEEAERLCDRVAILDRGRIVALDTPPNLVRSLGVEHRVVFTYEGTIEAEALQGLPGVTRVEVLGERVVVYGRSGQLVADVVNAITSRGVRVSDLRTEQPNLEDVFLALTGREMHD